MEFIQLLSNLHNCCLPNREIDFLLNYDKKASYTLNERSVYLREKKISNLNLLFSLSPILIFLHSICIARPNIVLNQLEFSKLFAKEIVVNFENTFSVTFNMHAHEHLRWVWVISVQYSYDDWTWSDWSDISAKYCAIIACRDVSILYFYFKYFYRSNPFVEKTFWWKQILISFRSACNRKILA